jgi:hypothetical protein
MVPLILLLLADLLVLGFKWRKIQSGVRILLVLAAFVMCFALWLVLGATEGPTHVNSSLALAIHPCALFS